MYVKCKKGVSLDPNRVPPNVQHPVVELGVSHNLQAAFTIPTSLFELDKLRVLVLHHAANENGGLYGSLPTELGNLV